MTVQDRNILLQRLQQDLIGPFEEHEVLNDRPSDVYLTGILWPGSTRMGAEDDDRLAVAGIAGNNADSPGSSGEEEEVSSSNIIRPSTAGISFAVSSKGQDPILRVRISFAIYEKSCGEEGDGGTCGADGSPVYPNPRWQRRPFIIDIPDLNIGPSSPGSFDLESYGAPPNISLHRRIAPWGDNWLVTLTLVNKNQSTSDRDTNEQNSLFQIRLEVHATPESCLIARPSRRVCSGEEMSEEDRSTALLYRTALDYAVGHTCSAEWEDGEAGHALMVATTWLPRALVFSTSSSGHPVFDSLRRKEGIQPLSAEWLSGATDEELERALSEIPAAYGRWIDLQKEKLGSLDEIHKEQAIRNLAICRKVRDRMSESVALIGRSNVMAEAFRLANHAMAVQYNWDPVRRSRGPLIWRPFQLGFILLSIPSVADRTHPDRDVMDLLWFPTGGGKTEAYLGLIAFLAFYRRLSGGESPDSGAGVAAVMRYTLRLLTTQQFVRAASMILACEAIRRGSTGGVDRSRDLGNKAFSIGLWVGGDATPNRYDEARRALLGDKSISSPAQLATCPACGSLLDWYDDPQNTAIRVRCNNQRCVLHSGNISLPVFTVDEDIYRECPTLLIGTADKFAQIARKSKINDLFSVRKGNPPDLIIQDELHLISGPLGTMAGLYEVAIDRMFTNQGIIPKIIGSTATIRRATEQVRALFNRDICQFPPSAIDADDAGFAVRDPVAPGRIYAGVTTAGRSAKFTLQAVAASLLQAVNADLTDQGRDHYWTMVTYFNSLRELGGALVLMQDDVKDQIAIFAGRRGEHKREPENIEELTSRRTQAEVRDMLDLLSANAEDEGAIDAVLATNMVSVGVDIPRLGLMVVNGQPKGTSEYIQATSRVGRGDVPGLVVTVLNNAKPRDRSHFESFSTWHATLYRDVEATSVTPFASRARDRALHAVLVSLVRHLVPGMLEDPPVIKPEMMGDVDEIISYIVNRANNVDPDERAVERELRRLADTWVHRNKSYYWNRNSPNKSLLQDAERAAALRAYGRRVGEAWPTMNNLRSVEPSSRFRLAEHLSDRNRDGDEHAR